VDCVKIGCRLNVCTLKQSLTPNRISCAAPYMVIALSKRLLDHEWSLNDSVRSQFYTWLLNSSQFLNKYHKGWRDFKSNTLSIAYFNVPLSYLAKGRVIVFCITSIIKELIFLRHLKSLHRCKSISIYMC
jgi:hypothetical protein